MKFTEIFRLKKMLEEANIPFQFSEKSAVSILCTALRGTWYAA